MEGLVSSCPYSQDYLEGVFSEVRIMLSWMASCLWWKGLARRDRGGRKESRHVRTNNHAGGCSGQDG